MEFTIPKGKRKHHQPQEFIYNVNKVYNITKSYRKTAKILGVGKTTVGTYVKAYKKKKKITPKQKTIQKVYTKINKDIRVRAKGRYVGRSQAWMYEIKTKDKKGRLTTNQPFWVNSEKLSVDEKTSTADLKGQVDYILQGINAKKRQGQQLTAYSGALAITLKGKAKKKYKYYHLTSSLVRLLYEKEIGAL